MTAQNVEQLIHDLRDSRKRTLELLSGLDSQQMIGPRLRRVNPLLWEIGHVAYFHELWTLRHLDSAQSYLDNADALFDSITIAHDDRWDLPLPSLDETLQYMHQVLEAEIARLEKRPSNERDIYLTRYAVFHEDMHTEAYTYSRQTLSYPAPNFELAITDNPAWNAGGLNGDVLVSANSYQLGADKDTEFCFDNEKWAHPVKMEPFHIARAATSNQQFAEFVDAGGYQEQKWWDDEGWQWLQSAQLTAPIYWKKDLQGHWQIRHFDQWKPMRPNAAVIHVNWHEANAWCLWAGRRLPSEAEWELASSGVEKHTFPWGETPPNTERANLDGRALGTIDVGALPESDSVFGCRQMIGNVWEWTANTFQPYPGFVADMYQDYSQPLFGETKVLRGGAWTTRSRMIRNTWRTYYGPERNDVFAGFRSCST